MNNQIPAVQGTVLRQYDEDGDHRDYPVVGWWNITGQFAQPLLPVPSVVVHAGSIIITPLNEWVPLLFCHPASGMVFEDENKMADFVGEYLSEHPLPKQAEPATPTTAAPATTAATSANFPKLQGPLHFGAQSFKTKSYWHWADANAIFEIDAEAIHPNDPRVKKIKRDEFNVLKRDGASVIDPHAGEVLADTKGDSSIPETPADEDDEDII